MKYKLFFIVSLISVGLFAQTGIGTTTPDASAKLEVSATNKGFLPPRVALSATNSASPITSPANGLMIFNTASAGANPYQVVPGYYYWDSTGQQWVSLSTTVGNVQNQAIFRSTANTVASGVVSTWNSRFNNIAAGDLTVSATTTFSLSNGIYKIQWGLPYQQSNTYNCMQLQENSSGTWSPFLSDLYMANVANGGNTDWGGTTFMTDVVDCTTATRTFRLIEGSGRLLYYGASFIITKLNPAITTSTTADNLGNHTATQNIQLGGNYLSNDGTNEGIKIDNTGKVGINTASPTQALDVTGNVNVTGKINLTDPSGNVAVKAANFVNSGVAVTLGDIQVIMSTGSPRSLQIKTSGTSFTGMVSAHTSYNGVSGTNLYTYFSDASQTINGTYAYLGASWGFGADGDLAVYYLRDTTKNRFYRITLMVGAGYNNNFISIERLL